MPAAPAISIILPVYGVAGYLTACLDSILLQPGAEIEVIAVDDASPDRCGQILDERAAADPRLRVLHLDRNGGPGPARNAGLGLAAGEYVWFVDGDDRLADGALAAIMPRLAEVRPDVLLIDYESCYPGGRTEPSPGRDLLRGVPPAGCTLADRPQLIDLTMTSWSKLLRRDFICQLGLRFGPGIHEDVLVTCSALLAARLITAVPRPCYRYCRDRRGSFMATSSAAHWAIFSSYEQVFALATRQLAPCQDTAAARALEAAIFERAIWHYCTVLQTSGGPRLRRRSLVPAADRRRFFARMHEDFLRYRPAGYRPPPGARGVKFRLVERGAYRAYWLLGPLNEARVGLARLLARH